MTTPSIIEEFLSSPDTQRWVADVLDYCAKLSAAIAETHGFHEDEHSAHEMLVHGIANIGTCEPTHQVDSFDLPSWLSAQLLTAEFGRVMSECGEAIENIRKPGPDSHLPEFPGWQVEAIDAIIRLFDTLGKRGISPGEIFVAKALINNSRPYKHGKNS